jgi:hypothetical protein
VHQWNLGDALDGHEVLYRFRSYVDEGTQTVIFAEVAAGRFFARRAVLNLADGLESYER